MRFQVQTYPTFTQPNSSLFARFWSEDQELNRYMGELTENAARVEELPEWTIRFNVHLVKSGHIGIWKKSSTFPSHPPEKLYAMYVPIPTDKEISWGVGEKDFVLAMQGNNPESDRVEGIDFSDFDSLSSYIVECGKKGIRQWLTKGIILKRVKIKI